MTTRAELRLAIRNLLDIDEEELPSAMIDVWLQDGYERAMSLDDRWPFFEARWDFTTDADVVAYSKQTISATHPDGYVIDAVASVIDLTDYPNTLRYLAHDKAEATFGLGAGGGGVPAYWSEWGGELNVWQAPNAGRTLRVRGFRRSNWVAGDDEEVDADSRLHLPISYFGIAMAYGQQEDEVLKAEWMREFEDASRRAHQAIMAGPQVRPLVLSGGGL